MKSGELSVAESVKKTGNIEKPDVGGLVPINGELLRDIRVTLEAKLGTADMSVADLTALKAGSVVTLGKSLADHVDLYLNGALVARGEIVAVGDAYGVRIIDLAQPK